jgi:DNA-directed RNA polymerase subunit RPC12/RpoP
MAIINCFECGKEVSDKAATCPNCGVAIAVKAAALAHEKKLTTTQLTSKNLKLHQLIWFFVFLVGLIMAMNQQDDGVAAGGLMLLGILGWIVTRVRIWWNHS